MKNFYVVLGVSPQAKTAEITKAFRAIARTCHPDVAEGYEEKLERYRRASRAYEVLKDEEKRKRYDRRFQSIDSLSALLRRSEGARFLAAMLPAAPKAPKPGLDTVAVVEVEGDELDQGRMVEVPILGDRAPVQLPKAAGAPLYGTLKSLGEHGRNGADRGDHFVIVLKKQG